MNRRGFLAATAALLITPTLTSKAQQAGKVPRVGFLYQLYRSETNGEPLAQRATTTIQGCGWLENMLGPSGNPFQSVTTPPKPAEATSGFSSTRKTIDNSPGRRYSSDQKKRLFKFPIRPWKCPHCSAGRLGVYA
jgi:hypothetical protein